MSCEQSMKQTLKIQVTLVPQTIGEAPIATSGQHVSFHDLERLTCTI